MNKIVIRISLCVIVILFIGCFSGVPSDSDLVDKATTAFEASIHNLQIITPWIYCSIADVKKTNGFKEGETYVGIFDYNIIFKVTPEEVEKDRKAVFSDNKPYWAEGMSFVDLAMYQDSPGFLPITFLYAHGRNFKPGDVCRKKKDVRVVFIKSDKGWIVK